MNGSYYIGKFKDGNWHGKGKFISSDGEIIKEGIWENNEI